MQQYKTNNVLNNFCVFICVLISVQVTFLQNCEPEFLHDLLLKMRLHIFTPGDLIIRHGEIAREMYLIAHGRIEVIR